MNILFVCAMGYLRSRTAADLFKHLANTDHAGVDSDAIYPLTKDQLEWADEIVCMERRNRDKLRRRFKGYSNKIRVLNIPDEYTYMDSELIRLLKDRMLK